MQIVRYSAGVLVMAASAYKKLIDILGASAAVSEEELLRILELQRLRAVAAEEHVKGLEIERLANGGRRDLAGLVERVAARDVAAGYDIRSFELDGSDRYIEVKSSTGSNLRFILSRNERLFLETHDAAAWIYFVPRVHELSSSNWPVIAIPTPSTWIEETAHVEPREFLVEFPPSTLRLGSEEGPTIWLPRRGGSERH